MSGPWSAGSARGCEAAPPHPRSPRQRPPRRPSSPPPTPRSSSHLRPAPAADPEPGAAHSCASAVAALAAGRTADTAGNGKSVRLPRRRAHRCRARRRSTAVAGTGTGGRATKKDILAFIETGALRQPARPPEPVPRRLPCYPDRQPRNPHHPRRSRPDSEPAPSPSRRAKHPSRRPSRPGADARAAWAATADTRGSWTPRAGGRRCRRDAQADDRDARVSPSTCADRSTPPRT